MENWTVLPKVVIPSEEDAKLLVIGPQEETYATKIWAFDLDYTIIKPLCGNKTGYKKPISSDDWYFAYDEFIAFSKNLANNEEIVVFSNQKNGDVKMLVEKINKIAAVLQRKLRVFVSLRDDQYRKPHSGMWKYFMENYVANDLVSTVFIGDAAGRVGDFSCSDRKFAYNAGLEFCTPEEFFKKQPPMEFSWDCVDFRRYDRTPPVVTPASGPELVLLVGAPASGKSSFSHKHFPDYTYINQDTINKGQPGTFTQCLKMLKNNINSTTKNSVVIDNTNAVRETRNKIIEVARKENLPIRCFWLTTPIEVCKHLNQYRGINGGRVVPKIVFDVYSKKFEEPTPTEGMEVIKVDFYIADDTITNYKF